MRTSNAGSTTQPDLKTRSFHLEVVKAHVATSPKYPETLHYRGEGVFMISGRNVSRRARFKAQNL